MLNSGVAPTSSCSWSCGCVDPAREGEGQGEVGVTAESVWLFKRLLQRVFFLLPRP